MIINSENIGNKKINKKLLESVIPQKRSNIAEEPIEKEEVMHVNTSLAQDEVYIP